jgi:hypothetical protein
MRYPAAVDRHTHRRVPARSDRRQSAQQSFSTVRRVQFAAKWVLRLPAWRGEGGHRLPPRPLIEVKSRGTQDYEHFSYRQVGGCCSRNRPVSNHFRHRTRQRGTGISSTRSGTGDGARHIHPANDEHHPPGRRAGRSARGPEPDQGARILITRAATSLLVVALD